MYAADGDASKVAELLSQGARGDAREQGKSTTIHTPIIQFTPILQKRSFQIRMGAALLVYAAADGDASKVAELLSQGARVDAREHAHQLPFTHQSFTSHSSLYLQKIS